MCICAYDARSLSILVSLSVIYYTQSAFKTGRCVYLTSRAGGKSLRIVEKQVNGQGSKGKKGEAIQQV